MSLSHAMTIRGKKLGVLIRDARLYKGKQLDECAESIDITPAQLEAFELGEAFPSLPQLELLSFVLDVPLEHFWGQQTLKRKAKTELNPTRLISIRQRMIGVLLRQARTEAGISIDDLAGIVGVPSKRLLSYETGEIPVPLPILEELADQLNHPIRDFQDQNGPVGAREAERRAHFDMAGMPAELKNFVSKPINQPYLELAQRLSEMSVEKLRAVAEGLLEITL